MLGALREGLADPFAAERPHVWVAQGSALASACVLFRPSPSVTSHSGPTPVGASQGWTKT